MTVITPTGKCGVIFKGRPPCRQPAGWGTDHSGFGPCKNHGGTLTAPAKKAHDAMVVAYAMKDIARLGGVVATDPEQALLDLVSQSAALTVYYGQGVSALTDKPVEEVAAAFTAGGLWSRAGGDYGELKGLFGPEVDVDKDGTEHVVGEKLRGLVTLWNEERDRLSKYAKAALAAGIEKRRVELAEQQGEQVVVIVNNVLLQLGMSPDQVAQARTMIAAGFRQLPEREVPGK